MVTGTRGCRACPAGSSVGVGDIRDLPTPTPATGAAMNVGAHSRALRAGPVSAAIHWRPQVFPKRAGASSEHGTFIDAVEFETGIWRRARGFAMRHTCSSSRGPTRGPPARIGGAAIERAIGYAPGRVGRS